jgi:hypothetical protein
MHSERLAQVFQRSSQGRMDVLSDGVLPDAAQRLWMRLNGFTAFADLLDPQLAEDEQLALLDDLLALGLVEAVDVVPAPSRSTSWGELALGLTH